MSDPLTSRVRALVTWPIRLTYEVVEIPQTLRNIRLASQRIGPAIDEVSDFASRAEGLANELESTLADLGLVARTLGTLTTQAKVVNDQWRRTMGRMPIVGRVAAEIERTAAQLGAVDDDPTEGEQ
ncbi:MAG: hypothetical protein R3249_04255 [Nitriliruptorales bacterium]|nr:hypothetical protein [Nitriliruptorales bacterium]